MPGPRSALPPARTSLRQAGLRADVIESHPAGYLLAVPLEAVDAVAFEALARAGSQALAAGDAVTARRALRDALGAWRGPALADASGARFAAGPRARLEESRTRAAVDLIDARLALGESDSLIGELRGMIAADPVAERPRGLLMRALYAAGRQAEALAVPDPEAPDQIMIMNEADPGEPADDAIQVAGYASVRLLADRAAAVRPDFTVNAANAADVTRICRALDGM